jgi:hypothetical protein
MADNLAKMEARIRELEAQRAKGKDVPELDALYAKMDAANRKGADEASKTVTGEQLLPSKPSGKSLKDSTETLPSKPSGKSLEDLMKPVKKAKGGSASARADGCAIRGKTRA